MLKDEYQVRWEIWEHSAGETVGMVNSGLADSVKQARQQAMDATSEYGVRKQDTFMGLTETEIRDLVVRSYDSASSVPGEEEHYILSPVRTFVLTIRLVPMNSKRDL